MSDKEEDLVAAMEVSPADEEVPVKETLKEKTEDGEDVSDDERKHKKKKKKKDKDREKDKDRKRSRKEKSEKEEGKKEEAGEGSDGSGEDKEAPNGKGHHDKKDVAAVDDDDDLLKDEREKRNLKERDRGDRDRDHRGGGGGSFRGRDSRDRVSRDRPRERSRSRGRDRIVDMRRRRSPSRDRQRRRSFSRDRDRRRRSPSRDRNRRDRDRYRRPRSRSRSRSRERSSRRRRSSPSSSSSSRSKSPSRSKKTPEKKKEEAPAPAPMAVPTMPAAVAPTGFANPTGIPTLQEMLQMYPGIGIPEALQKIEEIKRAKQMAATMMTMPQPQPVYAPPPPQLMPQVAATLAAAQQVANAIPNAAATKSQRELYVGNLPTGITGPQLAEFLGGALMQLKLTVQPGNPIVNTWLSSDAHYAFCEFRTIDETNAALNLNGISVGPSQLRIGRPKNYAGPAGPPLVGLGALGMNMGASMGMMGIGGGAPIGGAVAGLGAGLGGMSLGGAGMLPGTGLGTGSLNPLQMGMQAAAAVPPGPCFLMMTNLPQAVDDMSVKALLQPFGELKSFNLLKDAEGKSKGTAVFEYSERSQAEGALRLSGIDIGGQKLQVQEISGAAAQALLKPVPSAAPSEEGASVVVRLGNMIDETMLSDPNEVNEVKEEVADECRTHGSVVSLEIPVPDASGGRGAGQGFIFVEFADVGAASRACKTLRGRVFDGKIVEADYYPKDLYDQKVYDHQTVAAGSVDVADAGAAGEEEPAAAAAAGAPEEAPEADLD